MCGVVLRNEGHDMFFNSEGNSVKRTIGSYQHREIFLCRDIQRRTINMISSIRWLGKNVVERIKRKCMLMFSVKVMSSSFLFDLDILLFIWSAASIKSGFLETLHYCLKYCIITLYYYYQTILHLDFITCNPFKLPYVSKL